MTTSLFGHFGFAWSGALLVCYSFSVDKMSLLDNSTLEQGLSLSPKISVDSFSSTLDVFQNIFLHGIAAFQIIISNNNETDSKVH